MSYWDFRCSICGRFISWAHDEYTDFGSCADMEPPDPVYYCVKCAKAEEEYLVKRGTVPSTWCKADFHRRAAKRLGLVEVGPRGAAWTVWSKPNEISKDYVAK